MAPAALALSAKFLALKLTVAKLLEPFVRVIAAPELLSVLAVKREPVIAPVCVIAPVDVIVRFWPMVDAAITKAALLYSEALFAPLLDNATAPVKLLLVFVNVMALAPALKFDVPDTVIAPDCVNAPVFVIVKLPTDCVTLVIPNAPVFTKVTLPLVVLVALKPVTV